LNLADGGVECRVEFDIGKRRKKKKKDTKEVVHVFHESRDLHQSKAKRTGKVEAQHV